MVEAMAWEKVLIADDDEALVQLLKAYLEAREFETILARDGMQAIMAIRRQSPAVLLLDVFMPGGFGYDVLQRLRAVKPSSAVRVIVMSASTDPEVPAKVKALGADEFLQKPLDLEAVHALLCRVVGRPYRPWVYGS